MRPRLTHLAIPLVLMLAILLPAACNIPDRAEPVEPAPGAAEPTEEHVAESVAEDLAAVVNQNANVRTGPGTGRPVAYWLAAGAEVTVVGRNADGTWLRIEHEGRPGWIFAALTDTAAEGVAEQPADTPSEPEPVAVEPTLEPEPEPEPTVKPELKAVTPDHVVATVTGSVVNLRRGPGTDHATAGQVRAGDQLHVMGRNADGSWLQVLHLAATGEHVWVYGPLTDMDTVSLQTLPVVAAAVAVEPPPTPAPQVSEPTQEPVAPARQLATPTVPADCTRLHTVNPNETRLVQITAWFELDLDATATLNGIEADTPLTAGWQICLPEAETVQPQSTPAPQPAPAPSTAGAPPQPAPAVQSAPVSQRAGGGTCQTSIGARPCFHIPDFPAHGTPNAPIGQKVVDSGLDILWHAPGSYSRDLPGLDYDFELVFADNSAQWDWSVRDFEGCYDALRVHMGGLSAEAGLTRLEFRLTDPIPFADFRAAIRASVWVGADFSSAPWVNPVEMPWPEYPTWEPAALPHPDLGVVAYGCFPQPAGQVLCDIMPFWGNSHSIHLHAAAAMAMANSVAYLTNNLSSQYTHLSEYNRLHDRVLQANAYLFPLLDNRRGDPAGHGACVDLWRAS